MKFAITAENKTQAYTYLDNKMRSDLSYLCSLNDLELEQIAFEHFKGTYTDGVLYANLLDQWCRKYLTEKQFQALRAAIRKRKSRKANDNTSIELEKSVYSDLNDLAAAEGMNIKEYLTSLIKDKHSEVNPPVAFKAKERRCKR
mgnify:CR=1 FL=1